MRRDEDMEKGKPVSYVCFETAFARVERHIRRLWVMLIVALAILAGSNAAWFFIFTR